MAHGGTAGGADGAGCAWARLARWTADSAINLAVFRVVVGVVWLRLPDLHTATRWASLPPSVRTAPVGLGSVSAVVPITPGLAEAAYAAVLVGLAGGIVGLASRASWTVVTVAGLYLLGIPQMSGAAFHYHHLVWFAAVLAASPCGDALSVDAWLARRRGRPLPRTRDVAHGLPLRVVWILIGMIFLFPGVWKLITSGPDWILGDNLRNQMWAKWAQKQDFTPLFRIDRYPALLKAGAFGVVALELSFLPLVLFRRTRAFAVAGALLFHQLTAYFMGLRFPALWLCYVAFVDWDRIGHRLWRWRWRHARPRTHADEEASRAVGTRRGLRAAAAVGAVLVTGVFVFGALGLADAWPFACYPKFDRVATARMPELAVVLVAPDGSLHRVPVAQMSPDGASQRWWALSWSLIGTHARAEPSEARFRAFWRQVRAREPLRAEAAHARAVRFYRVWRTTDPDRRATAAPLAQRLLYELPLPSDS